MGLGLLLKDHYGAVKHWLDPLVDAFAAAALAAYLLRILRCRRLRKEAAAALEASTLAPQRPMEVGAIPSWAVTWSRPAMFYLAS